jgi:uncharacterized protein
MRMESNPRSSFVWPVMKSIFAVQAVMLLSVGTAAAQVGSPAEGITVAATGEAMVKPNKLELEVNTSVSAELTADAVVKYRDALKRTKETIDKLKIENLELSEHGVSVASTMGGTTNVSYVMQGRVITAAQSGESSLKPEVSISKSLRLSVKGIDKLSEEQVIALVAKLLDGVKDAGLGARPETNNLSEGQPNAGAVIMFIADDLAAARKKATEQAFSRAKEKAQRIAELAGGHLGAATAVDEVPAGSGEDAANETVPTPMYVPGSNSTNGDGIRLASPTLADIPVRVGLQVRFKLQPAEAAK